jgi:hypothetical protein
MTEEINSIFKIARESQNIRQSYLAEIGGVDRSAISLYESGVPAIDSQKLLKMIPELCINPEFIEGSSPNPFKCRKLIKMKIKGFAFLDTTIFHVLVNYNSRLEFISLIPVANTMDKVDRIFTPNATYAALIRDDLNNIFLIRSKIDSVYLLKLHEKNLEHKLLPLISLAGKKINDFTFRYTEIDKTLYEKIKEWKHITRKDVEPYFDENTILEKKADAIVNDMTENQWKKLIKICNKKFSKISSR